jgi:peptidoglycan/xylan/chitin deacetylase (PgdA/CDA1 family)
MRIPILMYHQVDVPPPSGTPLRGLVVSPGSFARQMWLLRCLGYKGMSMRNLEPYMRGTIQGKVIGITFDDGYENTVLNALPVLRQMGFTATCYAVSDMIGQTNSWDRHLGVEEKPLMSLDDWLVWKNSGMEIGSHTRTHANLTKLSAAEAYMEIVKSKQELERLFDCEIRHFCYPFGQFEKDHSSAVKEAGYASATTTHRGLIHNGDNPFTLRRVMIARATNVLQFALKVTTGYEDRRS